MKLGIVGSRKRNSLKDKELIRQRIIALKPDMIVSGGCPKGADKFAEELSVELSIPIEIFRPDLRSKPGILTRYDVIAAYYARNRKIAENADYLIALVALDRKGGTENTICHFKEIHGEYDCEIL